MDSQEPLQSLITKLEGQNKVLSRARHNYLDKEAQRKHFEATQINSMVGKSHAERESLAQGTKDWLEFHKDLAKRESLYQFELFKFKILELEFQATYLNQKQDGGLIERQRGT